MSWTFFVAQQQDPVVRLHKPEQPQPQPIARTSRNPQSFKAGNQVVDGSVLHFANINSYTMGISIAGNFGFCRFLFARFLFAQLHNPWQPRGSDTFLGHRERGWRKLQLSLFLGATVRTVLEPGKSGQFTVGSPATGDQNRSLLLRLTIVLGWWLSPTPLKNMSSSVGIIIPNKWKKNGPNHQTGTGHQNNILASGAIALRIKWLTCGIHQFQVTCHLKFQEENRCLLPQNQKKMHPLTFSSISSCPIIQHPSIFFGSEPIAPWKNTLMYPIPLNCLIHRYPYYGRVHNPSLPCMTLINHGFSAISDIPKAYCLEPIADHLSH